MFRIDTLSKISCLVKSLPISVKWSVFEDLGDLADSAAIHFDLVIVRYLLCCSLSLASVLVN